MSNAVYDFASEVVDDAFNVGGKRQKFLDPVSIGVLADLIFGLIKSFQECRTSEDNVLKMSKNMSRRQERFLNRRVKREMGRREYREDGGREIHKSLVKKVKTLTKEKIRDLYDAEEI